MNKNDEEKLNQEKSNDYQVLEEKLNNFKKFIGEVSENKEAIKEYENLNLMKLSLFATFFLVPYKDNLDVVLEKMRDKLRFSSEHDGKIKRYLEMFIDYLA